MINPQMFYIDLTNDTKEYIDDNANSLGFEVLFGNAEKGYFTVQDNRGYRAYCQASRFNKGLDVGISFKPSLELGSSCHIGKPNSSILDIINYLKIALKEAEKYPKDARVPKTKLDKYLA